MHCFDMWIKSFIVFKKNYIGGQVHLSWLFPWCALIFLKLFPHSFFCSGTIFLVYFSLESSFSLLSRLFKLVFLSALNMTLWQDFPFSSSWYENSSSIVSTFSFLASKSCLAAFFVQALYSWLFFLWRAHLVGCLDCLILFFCPL